MSEKLHCGVIGMGILGSAYANFFHARPETQVTAVADIRLEVAQKVATQVGAQAYADYHEMLRQHTLDLVAVATPDPYHCEPTLAVLQAGVPNVFLEKPMATTREDAQAIYEAVEARKARLFMNFANRATPLDQATDYVIKQGLLGKVPYAEMRLDDNISVPTALWGANSRAWAAGSSTAHFLLSHVVDLLRWHMAPAEVREVYAISQREVLGFTPDVYDAFLTFDNGFKARVKAEWTKHIEDLVEFYQCFSGSEGTVIYNKRGGFGVASGWRANLSQKVTDAELLGHQGALLERGINVAAMRQRMAPGADPLTATGGTLTPALEYRGLTGGVLMAITGCFLDAILQGTLEPTSWQGRGPLPTHVDGWKQSLVTTAIVRSAETGRAITIQ